VTFTFSWSDQCEPAPGDGRRLNWERANLNKKAKLSLSDEREFMERDRAARWLEHQEQGGTNAAQSRVAPSVARVGDNNQTRRCRGKVKVNLIAMAELEGSHRRRG